MYEAYGLGVDSEFRLPIREVNRAEADVRVVEGETPNPPDPVEEGMLHEVSDGHYVSYPGVGALYAADGEVLVIDPDERAEEDVLAQFVLGAGFRALLHQRGYVVFHASAAVVDGRAVAFLGESGRGKSTTVAGFHDAGHPVLADDVTAVEPATLQVQPGFPSVKLDRATATAVNGDLSTTQSGRLTQEYYDASPDFSSEPVPLAALYFLENGPDVRVESIPPSERPYRLLCASASAYNEDVDSSVPSHFDDCVRLSKNVSVRRLQRPLEFDALLDVVRTVEADIAETPTNQTAET